MSAVLEALVVFVLASEAAGGTGKKRRRVTRGRRHGLHTRVQFVLSGVYGLGGNEVVV